MTDGDALYRAILADPGDDLPRLVYADWLDDAGEADRAALIRVQIELAASPTAVLRVAEERLLGSVRRDALQRRREWALPAALRSVWPDRVGGWEWVRGFPEVWHAPLEFWDGYGSEILAAGPVSRVVLTDREPQAPPGSPTKPERTWYRDDANWVRRPDRGCLLPPELFDLLEPDWRDFGMFAHARTYPNRAAAVAALSDACLSKCTILDRNGSA